jgi:DNA-binding MarR family transcriptional regulator
VEEPPAGAVDADAVDAVLAQWRTERPDLDPRPMGVIGRLSRASRLIDRRLKEHFAADALEPWEFDVLATLRRAQPIARQLSAGELVASSMVTSGAITNRVDRLVARGLVTRVVDPDNRRRVLIGLTDAGRALVDRAVVGHLEHERAMLSGLTDREQDQLAALLRTLLLSLDTTDPA